MYISNVCRCLQKPKRALDPLQLEYRAVVNCLIWALGTTLVSSERSASMHIH